MPVRSFRVSEKFLKHFEMIQNYYKDELGLEMNQRELLDEMIELYYCRIILKSNILDDLFKEELRNNLQLYMIENAKMLNHVIEMCIRDSTKYPKKPNSIKDPKYSIECGIKDFADALLQSTSVGLGRNDALLTSVDAYNKGLGIIKRHSKSKKYSLEESCKYCYDHRFNNNKKGYSTASKLKLMFNLQPNQYWDGGNWRWNYGNMFYVYQVLSYLNVYSFNNDGSAGANIINIASSKIGCRY